VTDQSERSDTAISDAVEDAIDRAGYSLLSTVFWTILAVFTILVGAQAIQFGLMGAEFSAIGLIGVGGFIIFCSLYLLYSLHWSSS